MLDALETCLARALLASAVGALGHQCGVDAVEEEEASNKQVNKLVPAPYTGTV